MATKTTERDEAEAPVEQTTDGPLLDLTDQGVRRMIRAAKKRGYVTVDELNEVLPSDQVDPDKIEDIMSMLSEMGINVVEAEDTEESQKEREAASDEEEAEGTEVTEAAPARAVALRPEPPAKEPTDRTDDPVRMYLREMGSVELLSREGEIAIAKRIEAGREAMIAGLCESPLTFQAIIIWRDELEEGRVLLRDIIDLEATYAGPDGKNGGAPEGAMAACSMNQATGCHKLHSTTIQTPAATTNATAQPERVLAGWAAEGAYGLGPTESPVAQRTDSCGYCTTRRRGAFEPARGQTKRAPPPQRRHPNRKSPSAFVRVRPRPKLPSVRVRPRPKLPAGRSEHQRRDTLGHYPQVGAELGEHRQVARHGG